MTLLVIEEDLFHDRKQKEVIRSSTDASIKCEGSERHSRGK